MSGGMRFTPEQLRALPLSMQEKIGLAIAAQLKKDCSRSGTEKNRNGEPIVIGEWPVKEIPKELQCPFNAWVKCPEKSKCPKCGWNPIVERERLELKYGIRVVK